MFFMSRDWWVRRDIPSATPTLKTVMTRNMGGTSSHSHEGTSPVSVTSTNITTIAGSNVRNSVSTTEVGSAARGKRSDRIMPLFETTAFAPEVSAAEQNWKM